MRSDPNQETNYDGKGLKGPFWATFGVLTGAVAKYITGIGPGAPLFGGPGGGPGGGPVSREILDLKVENQGLRSEKFTLELDSAQKTWNAVQEGRINCLQRQVDGLYGMTRLTIPNENLTPGVGPVRVIPAPPPPPPPVPAVPDVATITAVVQAVLAQQKTAAAAAG